jgi:hypothetical protein
LRMCRSRETTLVPSFAWARRPSQPSLANKLV